MSSYDRDRVILSAEARRQIALSQARSRLDVAVRRLNELRHQVAAACDAYPGQITSFDLPAVRASEVVEVVGNQADEFAELWIERHRVLQTEEHRAQRQLMLASLADVGDGRATAATDVLGAAGAESDAEPTTQMQAVVLAKTLHEACTETERDTVREIVEQIGSAGTNQRRVAFYESLVDTIGEANREAMARQDRVARADTLRAQLAGIDGIVAIDLLRRIDLAEEGSVPLDGSLEAAVADAAKRTQDDADANYVGEVAERVLEDLGYEVQVGFAERLSTSEVYARLGEWPDHAVRFTMSDGALSAEQVRVQGDAGDPALDNPVQTALCEQHESFLSGLADHGVETERAELVPAGVFASSPASLEGVEFEGRQRGGKAERFIGGGP